ncbi:MAG: hypothetical protein AB7L13_18230 [Acidimicrobiia bacterium]
MTDVTGVDEQQPVDLRLVVAEIYEEVQQRRRSGVYPPGLERELDAVFAQYAPPAAVGDDMAVVLDRAERASFIDVDVPTASNLPGVPFVKGVLRKLMAWYLRYVTQQVSALGGMLVRAMKALNGRVARLEEAVPAASPRVLDELRSLDYAPIDEQWVRASVVALKGVRGRILHAECGKGEIVGALVDAGLDAYGVDPRRDRLGDGLRHGLDVRADQALEHLRRLPSGSLGGLIVSGLTDHGAIAVQLELADLATEVLAHDGVLVIVSSTPEAWAGAMPIVQADLAPGRPLHVETWTHLLTARGFKAIEVQEGALVDGGLAVPAGADDVTAANLAKLNRRLYPAASYAVVARR